MIAYSPSFMPLLGCFLVQGTMRFFMPQTKEHSVFILGAGCSKPYGAPLMAGFLDEARRLYFELQDRTDIESFDRVFDALGYFSRIHSKANLDLVNLETVFSAFEMARLLGKLPDGCQTNADTLIGDLKRVIVVTLERSIQKKPLPRTISPGDEPCDELADVLYMLRGSARGSAVITFNYDLLCDYAFDRKGLNLLYCLTETGHGGKEPKLLKLHGSLNWFL
jgi:hypothetical protein